MHASPKIQSSEYADLNSVIRWFLLLRWIACIGVFIALITGYSTFHLKLHYGTLFIVNATLFAFNLIFTVYYFPIKHENLSRKEMSFCFNAQVCSDYALLLLLCYFTGFLENPFIYYFTFHIMMTSFIFSARIVYLYVSGLIAVLLTLIFFEYYRIIPHYSLNLFGESAYFETLFFRTAGLCTTLIISAYLITSIKKRIEERGKKVEVELNRYKSLDKIKSSFILQVTHELRGPLAALMGYHEMVIRGITDGKNIRTVETIRKANFRAKNLLTMIDEMIDYAYMKSEEELEFSKTETRMKDVIDYNLDLFMNLAKSKRISFRSNCSKDLSMLTNKDLLNIILSNLISNAIKYSTPDTTVTVNAEKDLDKVHIHIKDEGMGIKPEEIDKIFEEFFRTRRAREVERDGTGLGLPIVQKAVKTLSGKITVYSEEGKGTSFHIYLPG